jgi:hypothetical protein
VTTIIRRPQGLVSLLELRDMGAVPRDIVPTVQGGVDLTQFFLVDRENSVGTNSFAAVGNHQFFVVPPGELWYIHAFGARSDGLTVGQRIGIGCGQQSIAGSAFVPMGDVARGSNTDERAMCTVTSPGFWMNPGSALLIQVTDIAAGPIVVSATVVFSRLRV